MGPPPKKKKLFALFFLDNKSHPTMFWPKPNHDSNPSQTMTLTACPVGRTFYLTLPKDTQRLMTPREQFNCVVHDSNPSQTMTLTACPVGATWVGALRAPPQVAW